MHCLWLTCVDPQPEFSGQFIYSGRLIEAFAAAGAEVQVLCLARRASKRRNGAIEGRVSWRLVEDGAQPAWASFASPLPNVAFRWATAGMRGALRQMLEKRRWDSIVFDGLFAAWALTPLLRYFAETRTRPRLVYISHNHEETTRAAVAANYRGNSLERLLLGHDARKARQLERRLVDAVDLVTAITREDALLYARRRAGAPTIVLLPGYQGRQVRARRITADIPRRAVVVGSFDWVAKRMNLQEFVAVADPMFAGVGAQLQVIGNGDAAFIDKLRASLRVTTLTGTVDSIYSFMDEARIAIVPERTGGGFKLKILDYVFNRLPIAALENSIVGVPLQSNDSVLTYGRHEDLAHGVLAAIDDLDLLNRLQERAFAACVDRFDWETRGRELMAAMAAS
jgi:glycosyltransferase involved in cell wall biosynthesis